MEETLLILLKQMQEEKKARKIEPCHITRTELTYRINQMLNKMAMEQKIKTGRTLNSILIQVI